MSDVGAEMLTSVDEIPRIYMATPLTNLDEHQQRSLCAEVAVVRARVEAVTVGDRVDEERWPVAIYAPIDHTAPWDTSKPQLTPSAIYELNLTELLSCDAMIVLADRCASAGVGQEIEWAVRAGIPILYLSHDATVSRQIQGIPAELTTGRYGQDTETLNLLVTNFIRHRRLAIVDGPRRRADRKLRHAPITSRLRAAWEATNDRTSIAGRCGVTNAYVDLLLADPARVAVMPVHLYTSLAAELGVRQPGPSLQLGARAMRALISSAEAEGWSDETIERLRLVGLASLSRDRTFDLDTLPAWQSLFGSLDHSAD